MNYPCDQIYILHLFRPQMGHLSKQPWIYFILLILFNQPILAQKDFRDGFVITNEADTIYGKIDYRTVNKSYESCIFKSNDLVIVYTPDQILGYGFVSDRTYTSQGLDSVFAEILISGTLSLYKYKSSYYIRKDLGQVIKLEYTYTNVESANSRNSGVSVSNRDWLQKFSNQIVDCFEDPNVLLNDLSLKETSLVNAVNAYNTCRKTESIQYNNIKPAFVANFGILTGVSLNKLKKGDGRFPAVVYRSIADEYKSNSPFIGVSINYSSPRFSENVSVQQEIHFSKASYTSTLNTESGGNDEIHDVRMDLNFVSIPFAMKFSTFGSKMAYAFYAGGNLELMPGSSSILKSTITKEDNTVVVLESEARSIRKSSFGPWLGLGVQKKFKTYLAEVSLRYFTTGGLTNREPLGLETRQNRLLLTLQISTRR